MNKDKFKNYSNSIGEIICKTNDEKISFLDKNNIIWKSINDKWIGKRSVYTLDLKCCWLEDTNVDNVKIWWCGKNNNYSEIFKRKD
jgi:hypothetical protein